MHDEPDPSSDALQSAGRLVCVFGVSGVGKSTLIAEFVRKHANWQALSASALLEQLTHQTSRELRVADRMLIQRNQSILARVIYNHRIANPSLNTLLDAHSVIDNDRELITLPVDVIERISPDLLVFIFDIPAKIRARRAEDQSGRRPLPLLERIDEEQRLAFETCLAYSNHLLIRLVRVRADNPADFARAILEEQPAQGGRA